MTSRQLEFIRLLKETQEQSWDDEEKKKKKELVKNQLSMEYTTEICI